MDFDRINYEEFFGCVNATNTTQMKSNTFKTFRTHIQEKSFAKWSDDQLVYVGDHKDGLDFLSTDTSDPFPRYEMKGMLKMFNKNGTTKVVTMKNFRGENKVFERTFDYIFLVDTENMSIALSDWQTAEKRHYFTESSPVVKVKFYPGDYEMIRTNVMPSTKSITAGAILDSIDHIL